MQDQLDVFINSMNQFWVQLVNFIPKLLVVIVVLFLGWIFAKLIRTAIKRLLVLIQFDKFAERSGLEAFIKNDWVDFNPEIHTKGPDYKKMLEADNFTL